MRAAWLALLCACTAPPPKPPPVDSAPLAMFTNCSEGGSSQALQAHPEWCLFVELTFADGGSVRQWPLCGSALCESSLGHGFIPADGHVPVPIATWCVGDSAEPVAVRACIPSFEPLRVTATPQRTPQGMAAQLECVGHASADFTFKELVFVYDLIPRDGGAEADGGCPLAPASWSRQLSCCEGIAP